MVPYYIGRKVYPIFGVYTQLNVYTYIYTYIYILNSGPTMFNALNYDIEQRWLDYSRVEYILSFVYTHNCICISIS